MVFLQAAPPQHGKALLDRILAKTGTTLTKVPGLPDCSKRTGVVGPLSPATPPTGTTDGQAGVGRVACLDLGGSTAVVWSHEPTGVIGVIRVQHDDHAAWKDFGPDWPPFAFVDAPG